LQYNNGVLKLLLVALVIFILLLIVELLWRVKKYRSEFTRKSIHILVGTFAAFWPWFLSWRQIELLALAFLIVVVTARYLVIFDSIHKIERKSIGDLLFAISIGLVALITHERWIFTAAVLHMSLADGLAAVIGTRYGKGSVYKIFGQRKSLVGTVTFWLCSLTILIIYFSASHNGDAWPTLLWLPLAATLLENVGIYGSDNLLVPLFVVIALRAL